MKVKGFQDTIDWYNQNASKYARSLENIPNIDQIDDFVKQIPYGTKVLDAGCAGGRDTKLMADRGVDIVGIDLSTKLIKVAKLKYPTIKFIEGNFLNLPFENNLFGGVWSHGSLLHFETINEVVKALKEFNRVLLPGGILHLFLKEKTTDKKFDVVLDSLSGHDRFFQYFTKEEVKKYLEETNFKIIKLEEVKDPAGRIDVKWILCLAIKTS